MPGPEVLGVAEFAKRVGMTEGTIRNYSSRGLLPEPDITTNKGTTKLWVAATVDKWNDERLER